MIGIEIDDIRQLYDVPNKDLINNLQINHTHDFFPSR